MKIVEAFLTLIHTDSGNVEAIAALKAELAEARANPQLGLSEQEQARFDDAVNAAGAVVPPPVSEVTKVADIAPAATGEQTETGAKTSGSSSGEEGAMG